MQRRKGITKWRGRHQEKTSRKKIERRFRFHFYCLYCLPIVNNWPLHQCLLDPKLCFENSKILKNTVISKISSTTSNYFFFERKIFLRRCQKGRLFGLPHLIRFIRLIHRCGILKKSKTIIIIIIFYNFRAEGTSNLSCRILIGNSVVVGPLPRTFEFNFEVAHDVKIHSESQRNKNFLWNHQSKQ